MMNILVDLYKIKGPYSGLGQFSMHFAKELVAQAPPSFALDFLVPKTSDLAFEADNVRLQPASFQKRYLPFLNQNYFLWHSLQQFPSFLPNKNTIWLLTIHDLNFMVEKNESKKRKYLRLLQRNIDRADYLSTISNYTREQIEKHIDLKGKKIRVIYNGVKLGQNTQNQKPPWLKAGKYFFSIGMFNAKKNFKVLLPLMKYFEEYQLILAGSKDNEYGQEVQEEVYRLGLENRVFLAGKIPESEKEYLYAHCEAFLFPSLAEGFGMPPIEAMQMAKPVFLSRYTSLPEIGGDQAFYFDSFEAASMAHLVRTKLQYVEKNPEKFARQSKEYAEKFNWKNCLEEYIHLYQEIENAHS